MRRVSVFLFSSFAFLSSALCASLTQVQTKYGLVEGVDTGRSILFKGLAYAAAPVGALRFQAPQEPLKWNGLKRADTFGSVCPQTDFANASHGLGSEDCLYMNITRPNSAAIHLPVMVWIHGGANTVGSATNSALGTAFYDGENLASHDVIVVTFNYRLGALGFLAHRSLASAEGSVGNYGVLDQIRALNYVRDSIEAFGGDPQNVTVFGESAGAIDTLVLMASPLAKGLFSKAIVQSGFLSDLPLATAEKAGDEFATAAGCTSGDIAACLRSLSTDALLQTSRKLSTAQLSSAGATIDGVVLKDSVLKTLQSASDAVPLLIGSNADEMRTLLPALLPIGSTFTDADYTQLVQKMYGTKASDVLAHYPSSKYHLPRLALEAALGDQYVHCPTRAVTRAVVRVQPQTFRYVFTHVSEIPALMPNGAGHALEIPYVFGNMNPFLFTPFEMNLSKEMQTYWASFAKTADPNSGSLMTWPMANADTHFVLDSTMNVDRDYHAADCDFWDQLN